MARTVGQRKEAARYKESRRLERQRTRKKVMPRPAGNPRDDYDILLAYGDLHLPQQHADFCRILLEIIKDTQPSIILDGGDVICADCLSTYPKKHMELVGLQEEIDEAGRWFASVRDCAPHARKIMLRDNHFWGRLENKKKGEYWLEKLEAVDADELLNLKKYGWEPHDTWDWRGRIQFIHGDDKAGSSECPVNRVRKMSRNAGKTIVRFHTHVTGIEVGKQAGVDQLAIQLGTFEDPKKASYIRYPNLSNWTTSAGLFYLAKQGDSFLFVPILFIDGRTVLNGKVYQ